MLVTGMTILQVENNCCKYEHVPLKDDDVVLLKTSLPKKQLIEQNKFGDLNKYPISFKKMNF